jgi:AraC-like DNA-binding protein
MTRHDHNGRSTPTAAIAALRQSPKTEAPPEPAREDTVLGALIAGHLEAARVFGLPAGDLAKAAGLRGLDLDDPDGRVPLERCIALWEAIDATPAGQDFGFWLGRAVSVASLGVVGFAMSTAPDVRTAFATLQRFRRLTSDAPGPVMEEDRKHVVFRRTEPARVARLTAMSAAGPVGTITLLRALTGLPEGARPLAVEAAFQHPPPLNAGRYQAELRCPVHFNAPETRLVLRRELFGLPVRRQATGAFAFVHRHARALEARWSDQDTMAARVRQHLVHRVRDREPQQATIARALRMSKRSLQRRLRAERTSFAALADGVRAELAAMYLGDPELAIYEVAFLLGYQDRATFDAAFHRWTGTTPRQHRARGSEGPPEP